MAITERHTDGSGTTIRYLDNAPEQPVGLPILFSPGFSDHADEYTALLDFFAPRRVLVVEVRGRGGSSAPATGYTAAHHAADLRAVLDAEGIDGFHLMTFSRGTTWGLDTVLADPSRVGSVSIGDYWPGEKKVPDSAVDYMLASRFRGKPLSERMPHHVPREVFRHGVERDLLGDLAATGIPVLVATGTEPGCLADAEVLQRYRDRLPDVEIVVIEGAAHDLFRPDRLAYPRAVRDFVERRGRPVPAS